MDTKEHKEFMKKWRDFIESYIKNYLKSRNSESNPNNEILKGKSRPYPLYNLKSTDKDFSQILEDKLLDFFIENIKDNTNYEINGVNFFCSFLGPDYDIDNFSFETY